MHTTHTQLTHYTSLKMGTHTHTHTHTGLKMGKSLGNVLEPRDLVRTYGSDNVRYYFTKVMLWSMRSGP